MLFFYSTTHLRRLRLACCDNISDKGLCEAAQKFPLLEELDISIGKITKDSLEVIGQKCPHFKSLKFNIKGFRYPHVESDEVAFAIANNMPKLRHLQLIGCKLTNVGLCAILNGCPHLESLDLRQCFNINLEGPLEKRCEHIKDLRRPNDPTNDYPFETTLWDYFDDFWSSDDDYDGLLDDVILWDCDDDSDDSDDSMGF